jgi:preprotein translocase subunit SecA
MFTELLNNMKHEVVRILARVQVKAEEDVAAVEQRKRSEQNLQYRHDEANAAAPSPASPGSETPDTYVREGRKVGRNEPCPCGSGQKYKQCHGKLN